MHIALRTVADGVELVGLDSDGRAAGRTVAPEELPAAVAQLESDRPRWVWDDTRRWYPGLLAAGVRVERCVDLRLSRAILRGSAWTAHTEFSLATPSAWDELAISGSPVRHPVGAAPDSAAESEFALFEVEAAKPDFAELDGLDPVAEFEAQKRAIEQSTHSGRLSLLLAAESAGALIASEMPRAGVPWSVSAHESILVEALGSRPSLGVRPHRLEELAGQIREALGGLDINPDSPQSVLKSLRRAGLTVESTRSWDLKTINHPAIAPLLEYRKRARLLTANGWTWLDTWVHDGRFRPEYVVGGVVTGRWAASGGGALQLPKEIRGALIADPGWTLVVADAAQLEPRILAGLSGDRAMVEAGRGVDLYQGMVDSGAVESRAHAKVGMLGAMYGGTTGDSGIVMPKLKKAFPVAIDYVERAARAGERGESVTTHLGRSSPLPGTSAWPDDEASEARERTRARAWGRFTRNFVVQGTAAEWAECWMASVRRRLAAAERSGSVGCSPEPFNDVPHLIFFVHDEIIVHSPQSQAQWVAGVIEDAAVEAGRLLFGQFPVTFPLSIEIARTYSEAK